MFADAPDRMAPPCGLVRVAANRLAGQDGFGRGGLPRAGTGRVTGKGDTP
jgi:hypothetical protein